MKKLIAALFVFSLFLTGCSTGSSSASVTNLGASEFLTESEVQGVVLIDVRTPGEFSEGHIVDALNIDVQSGSFESEIAALDKNATYALYCRSGNRSGTAADIMAEAGFTKILNAKVGFADLVNAGANPA